MLSSGDNSYFCSKALDGLRVSNRERKEKTPTGVISQNSVLEDSISIEFSGQLQCHPVWMLIHRISFCYRWTV